MLHIHYDSGTPYDMKSSRKEKRNTTQRHLPTDVKTRRMTVGTMMAREHRGESRELMLEAKAILSFSSFRVLLRGYLDICRPSRQGLWFSKISQSITMNGLKPRCMLCSMISYISDNMLTMTYICFSSLITVTSNSIQPRTLTSFRRERCFITCSF